MVTFLANRHKYPGFPRFFVAKPTISRVLPFFRGFLFFLIFSFGYVIFNKIQINKISLRSTGHFEVYIRGSEKFWKMPKENVDQNGGRRPSLRLTLDRPQHLACKASLGAFQRQFFVPASSTPCAVLDPKGSEGLQSRGFLGQWETLQFVGFLCSLGCFLLGRRPSRETLTNQTMSYCTNIRRILCVK